MREDNQLLVITHLSQLLTLFTAIGGLIVPLILWLTQRDKVYKMNEHGKTIMNFQISMLIYAIVCIPLIFLFGLGIVGLVIIGIIEIIFPIVNAVKASNRQEPKYPLSIEIIK